jgi:DNA-binding MarR family transcriptional regulator
MVASHSDSTAAHVESAEAARALNALRRLVRALRAATRDAERAYSVTTAQLFVLRELGATPGMSLGQLARRTHTTQSTVSEVVARLVDGGFIRRRTATEDARRRELSLTARGRAVVQRAPHSAPERMLEAFTSLPGDRRRALAEGLEAWVAAAGFEATPAPMFFERSARRERARRRREP